MNKFVATLPLVLCLGLGSCRVMSELLDVPKVALETVDGAVTSTGDVVSSGTAEAVGKVAETGTTLVTGNSALAAGVGAVVTLLAGAFLKRKKAA